MHTIRTRLDHLVGCVWFWVWALVGFAIAFGAVSTFGVLLVLPVGLIAALLATGKRIRGSAFGLLTGAGGLCLLVAALQQGGSNLDARPWLLIGLMLAVGGIVGHASQGD